MTSALRLTKSKLGTRKNFWEMKAAKVILTITPCKCQLVSSSHNVTPVIGHWGVVMEESAITPHHRSLSSAIFNIHSSFELIAIVWEGWTFDPLSQDRVVPPGHFTSCLTQHWISFMFNSIQHLIPLMFIIIQHFIQFFNWKNPVLEPWSQPRLPASEPYILSLSYSEPFKFS